jgi:hypothetical protein
LAVIRGIKPDTDDYFDFLEDQLYGTEEDAPPPPPPRQRNLGQRREVEDERQYAAPPSRTVRGGRNADSEEIDLTPTQKSYARSMGMSNKEYGKYLLDIKKKRTHLRLSGDMQ